MRKILSIFGFVLVVTCASQAAEIQGVIADWNCAEAMVKNGREAILKQRRSCSLAKNFNRSAYGLITGDKKLFRLDDPGNQRVLELLRNTPDKDNLKVIVTGDVQGSAIKVTNMSLL